MKVATKVIVVLCVILAMAACATFSKDAYRSLAVSYQTYDSTLSVMGELYKEGKITDAQKTKAIELGRAYKLAHNEAVIALARYEESGNQTTQDAYLRAATDLSNALAKLLAYCRPLIAK